MLTNEKLLTLIAPSALLRQHTQLLALTLTNIWGFPRGSSPQKMTLMT